MIEIKKQVIIYMLLAFCILVAKCSNNANDFHNGTEINLHLKDLIVDFIADKEKDSTYLGPRYKEFFYLVRFFEKDNINFVSIECTLNLPLVFCADDGNYYVYDIERMYYYEINNRNVIIMAPYTYNLNELVILNDKRKVSLEQANILDNEKSIPLIYPGLYTLKRIYQIDSSKAPLLFKPVFNLRNYPPYKTENELNVDIVEWELD